ncbi:SusC/RagA family TonB-linked outer membrane protein [Chitinophaga pinensis]|uniref:TonB-dependent receptor plug n=1 Tax=Chitinophaga pinensis (strain ATCC 43595 / DSM 2588 / LMG 13176 / NBRC 15968 / NCIMB 11800 / UQM 2034) TaxID=485918 RepID=A0A979GY64_CHIPD|nr:SusC/RagA family TonB-linked outer membrane protein [Chitinophaga pinensis]ACU62989.1 TonB-dependent receptor plug [Chitinophaga pinensis DSM 2588]
MVKHVCKAIRILLILCCLLFPATRMIAQGTTDGARVTITGKHIPLTTVFKSITRQTGYFFVFDNAIIDGNEKISLNYKNASWEEVLTYVLQNRNISWLKQGKRIYLQVAEPDKKAELSNTVETMVTIRGHITDIGNQPVPGATILVKGTSRGVTTGANGEFVLAGVSPGALLRISSLGYRPIDTILRSEPLHEIKLGDAVNTLDATVVIGYGSSSRRRLTGAVSRMTAEQLANQPVANVLSALQGQIPGIQVTSTNGLPGAQIKLFIRGRNSIAAGNDPLFIIDGVPFDITPLNNTEDLFGAAGRISPFTSINPADIESIDVLKDADATAIYGSRGANGVILITTKKGEAGDPRLDLNIRTGIGVTAGQMSLLGIKDYLTIRREAFLNDGVQPTVANAPDLLLWDTTLSTNWFKKLMGGTAPVTNAQLGFSGGSNYNTFLLSGNYYREGTVLPADLGYHRGGFHLSFQHHHPEQRLEAAFSASFVADNNRSIANDIFGFYTLPPDYPLYDSSGHYYWGSSFDNPLASLQQQSNSKTNNLLSNLVLRYRVLPGLILKTSLGLSDIRMKQFFSFPQSTQHPNNAPTSFIRVANNNRESFIVEPQADYNLRLGKGNIHALIGGTWQQTTRKGTQAIGQGYADEAVMESLESADTIIYRPDSYALYRYVSFFSRFTYDWKRKYLLNVSYRRDGSSRFGPGRQFGDFGSVGLGWVFTEESFVRRFSWLSFGKLRASGGFTGNDQIADYQYMRNYGTNGNYTGDNTLAPLRLADDRYSWEANKKMEAAIELGFLNDKLFFSAAKYCNRSSNQLVGYQLPGVTGFTSYQANLPAVVENTGWELEVRTNNFKRQDFSWTTAANISFFSNKLRRFNSLAVSSYANAFVIGQSLNIKRGYHFTGVDPQTGVPRFEDVNHDGKLSSLNDYVTIANLDPKFYGGIQNDLHYKNISLGFFWQFVKQEGTFPSVRPGQFANQLTESLERWRKPGDVTDIPRATATAGNTAYDMSSMLPLSNAGYQDASYVRLKNVYISYTMPEAVLRKVRLQLCKFYLQGQNLLTITGYKGADPETQILTPVLRVITSGIQLTL